ncbi:DUF3667 domain-containing protein [Aureibaculum conchae]|uniref:DUF3667 domain-containing protein n=1 Tax=Aureibaculum sp. 2308TA14-22 TaxID=3108392 RepID=UPI00339A2624
MKSTTRFSKNKRGIECLNCKQPISDKDNFCSNCGQVNDELPLSIKQFISEFFSGFFSFDTRFFKTFLPLLFKPGKVTNDYVEGKRRRYVNPFQLYLHVTIVFFLLQGLFSTIDEYKISGVSSMDKAETSLDTINAKDSNDDKINLIKDSALANLPLFKTKDSLVNYNTEGIKKNSTKTNTLKQKLLFRIDSIFMTTDFLNKLKSDAISEDEKDSIYEDFYKSNIKFISIQVNDDAKNDEWEDVQKMSALNEDANNYTRQIFTTKEVNYIIPEEFTLALEDRAISNFVGQKLFKKISDFLKYNKENKEATAMEAIEDLGLEKTRWNAFYYKIAQNINKAKDDAEFRSAYGKKIISNISLALFFLLPIFTLLVSLLYIRHKWNYTEHLVFVFNVQTVFFLLLIFFNIFDRILDTDLGILIFIPLFLFYLFKALRNFYEQHWFKTFIKFIILNSFYYILSAIGLLIVSFVAFVL